MFSTEVCTAQFLFTDCLYTYLQYGSVVGSNNTMENKFSLVSCEFMVRSISITSVYCCVKWRDTYFTESLMNKMIITHAIADAGIYKGSKDMTKGVPSRRPLQFFECNLKKELG